MIYDNQNLKFYISLDLGDIIFSIYTSNSFEALYLTCVYAKSSEEVANKYYENGSDALEESSDLWIIKETDLNELIDKFGGIEKLSKEQKAEVRSKIVHYEIYSEITRKFYEVNDD